MELKCGYKRTEVGIVPEAWEVCNLITVSSQITDGDHLTPKRVRVGHYLLSARNIRHGHIDLSDVDYVDTDEYKRMRQRCAPEVGDILISCSGHGLGKVSVVPSGLKCVLVRSAALVKLHRHRADGVFVQYWLQSAYAQNQISISKSLAAQPNLFINSIERLRCLLPDTVSEQRAIAGVLSDVDALLDGLDRLIAKKRDLKQAAMQQLLTGQIRLSGFHGEWKTAAFGDVATIRNSKVMASATPAGTQCIELESIGQGTGRLLGSIDANGLSSKYSFIKGDVLFGRLRAYLRKYWLATFDGICSTEIWPLIPRDDRLVGSYLHLLVQTDAFVNAACVSYGPHMPRSDWSVLRQLPVQVPSPSEQSAIASVISDMDAELASLEARRNKTSAIKEAMMQELLTGRTRLV